jgi:hypothetical protein
LHKAISVRIKEAWKRQRDSSNTPARELALSCLQTWSRYRGEETPLGEKILPEWRQATGDGLLGTYIAQFRPPGKVVACHFLEARCGPSSEWWGVTKMPARVRCPILK